MKYAKMLGLLAVAAAALMAFVGSASAATLTDSAGQVLGTPGATTEIHAKSIGATTLDGTINISCNKSTVRGTITDPHHVKGTIETLTFEECGNHTVEVKAKGTLTIEGKGDNTTGTVFSTGATVTVLTHSLFLGTRHCFYVTDNTHIGTFTESDHTPSGGTKHTTATLDIGSSPIGQEAGSDPLCGNDAVWTGKYEITHPDHVYIDG